MILFGMTAASLAGCKKNAASPPAMPPPKVTVARPVSHSVQAYYEYNGHLDAVESVEIRARVKGLLKDIHFIEGEEVEAGRHLSLRSEIFSSNGPNTVVAHAMNSSSSGSATPRSASG